ncbi:hypothetical protein N5T82_02710 [Aliarcobacter cryaerophilus]|uniref:hypothetical protein n=1 Tax=Aliarcobacter cryaerophilus TaxID=28198 RepID=UPI0021B60A7F|nr:hypothetical protein [Aliarcobacter cryaerophilus]MCT7538756.1 hypothetical protein [Aliarcobacter cryaerophilus]
MKLILINSYLNKFDSLRNNPKKNAYELAELRDEISSIITQYIKKHKKEDVFTDILNFIELDVNYELEKACETLEEDRGVQL